MIRRAVEARGFLTEDLLKAVRSGDGPLPKLVKDFLGAVSVPNGDGAALDAALASLLPAGAGESGDLRRLLRVCYSSARPIYITDTLAIEGGAQLRKFELGEILEIEEGPRHETKMQLERVRGRALKDGVSGWVTVSSLICKGAPATLLPGGVLLRATARTPLSVSATGQDDGPRVLQQGEVVRLLAWQAGKEGAASLLQLRAAKDGVVGWAPLSSLEALPLPGK